MTNGNACSQTPEQALNWEENKRAAPNFKGWKYSPE